MAENTSVEMITISVEAHPYANINGTIKVPKNLAPAKMREYVDNHFNKIKFEEPRLNFKGTDYELYDENGNDIEEDED